MPEPFTALLLAAASIGLIHTLIGPDHYVPFIAIARARDWSLSKTLGVTLGCGVGHVAGSVTLGALGIALGWALGGVERFEALRGDIAGWLLIGFGVAYTAWGVRRAIKSRPHAHPHTHADGESHEHLHTHLRGHVHVHAEAKSSTGQPARRVVTPWVLFLIFVFGPCEALIPVLMYPAAQGEWWAVAAVVAVFGMATLTTMTALVAVGYLGLSRLEFGPLERFSHALAGATLVVCGLAIQLGL